MKELKEMFPEETTFDISFGDAYKCIVKDECEHKLIIMFAEPQKVCTELKNNGLPCRVIQDEVVIDMKHITRYSIGSHHIHISWDKPDAMVDLAVALAEDCNDLVVINDHNIKLSNCNPDFITNDGMGQLLLTFSNAAKVSNAFNKLGLKCATSQDKVIIDPSSLRLLKINSTGVQMDWVGKDEIINKNSGNVME